MIHKELLEKKLRDKIIMMRLEAKEYYDNRDFLQDKRTILQIAPSSMDEAHKLVSKENII